jgi:hypothetical protein
MSSRHGTRDEAMKDNEEWSTNNDSKARNPKLALAAKDAVERCGETTMVYISSTRRPGAQRPYWCNGTEPAFEHEIHHNSSPKSAELLGAIQHRAEGV